MTSTANNTVPVPEKLREAIAESEVPAIAKAPYVQDDKFNTDYLTEWQNNGSCMAFMEPGKQGVGVAMIIGAERGNIITYVMSNKTGRFVELNLEMLNKKVTTGWPSVKSLKTKSKFVKPSKLKTQEVPTFFALTAADVNVILNNEDMIPSKLMNQTDIDENTKFWLKFAAGHGKNKQSSI